MLYLILALFLQAQGPIEEIKAGSRYIHVPLGEYVLTETLNISSGQTVVCEPGTVFVAADGAFLDPHAPLILLENSSHVAIYNCTFRMRKLEYSEPPYKPSEFRHGLALVGADTVRLADVAIQSAGGDGLYAGPWVTCEFSECRKPCKDITIDRLTVTDSLRNGLAVVSAVNLTVRDSVFEATKGTPPGSGIHCEPDHGGDVLQNIRFERCTARDNSGSAFRVNLDRQNQNSKPISVTFTDCIGERIYEGHSLIEVNQFEPPMLAIKPKGFVKFDLSMWSNQ